MTFSMEKETDNSISFVDITAQKKYRKRFLQHIPKAHNDRYHNT